MAVQAIVAAEIVYLLTISQLIPSVWKLRCRGEKAVAYPTAIGIICVVILQILFSQWSVLNSLFDTIPLNFTQACICIVVGLPVVILGYILRRFDSL